MAVNINVSAICPDKQIIINKYKMKNCLVVNDNSEDDNAIDNVIDSIKIKMNYALCCMTEENKYYIALNLTKIEDLWKNSWLYNYVSMDVFEAAFMLHELSHIKYTDFDNKVSTASAFKAKIRNILEDSRIEYRMSYDFPETSIFFNILLSSIQTSFRTFDSGESGTWTAKEADATQKLVNDLFDFTRYNLISKDANNDFVSKIVPLVLLCRRGSSTDCDVASEVIANMIKYEATKDSTSDDVPDDLIYQSHKPMTEDMRSKKQNDSEGTMKQIADKFFDKDSMKEQIKSAIESESKAGTAVAIENKERTSFFLKVAMEHSKEIEALRNIFKSAFTEFKNINAKDGDLNFMRQQEAYMNSVTGEEGNDYQYRKKEKILIDVVLLRDISGSIGSCRESYAKSIVIILSALENLQGVRTAQIDFNGKHFTNKEFDSGIEKATINPVAEGGTSISGAYKEVLNYKFKGKRNIVIVISDGSFIEAKETVYKLEEDIGKKAKILKYGIGGYSAADYKSISIEDIPKEMAQAIIKEGLQ